MRNNIIENLEIRIRNLIEDISDTAIRCGRDPSKIKLMAVTKGIDAELILAANKIGLDLFGENYIQEAYKKLNLIFESSNLKNNNFHFIGHLQRNKVNKGLNYFGSIDTADSFELVKLISDIAIKKNINIDIMIEVKTSNEPTKFGLSPDEAILLTEKIINLSHINLTGLMTMAPLNADEKIIRKCYKSLYKTHNNISNLYNLELPFISMGMSNDYKIAIEEGSTMLRLGRAIFGGI